MIKVSSAIKLNMPKIKQLTQAQVTALEQTAEALHTEVVQARVFPRDTGNLQNESTFVDYSDSSKGKVSIVSSTPYARRLYFHPEYHFQHTLRTAPVFSSGISFSERRKSKCPR